jgi:hypothetical protein
MREESPRRSIPSGPSRLALKKSNGKMSSLPSPKLKFFVVPNPILFDMRLNYVSTNLTNMKRKIDPVSYTKE